MKVSASVVTLAASMSNDLNEVLSLLRDADVSFVEKVNVSRSEPAPDGGKMVPVGKYDMPTGDMRKYIGQHGKTESGRWQGTFKVGDFDVFTRFDDARLFVEL